jgi:hypothetical protein
LSGKPTQNFTRLAIAIIIAAVVISASVLSYSSFQSTITRTTTTNSTLTFTSVGTITETATVTRSVTISVTGTSSATVTTTSSASQTGQVTFYRTNGDWNFSLTLSSLTVPKGQPIDAYVNVTNISGQTQRVHEVNPIINPVIYSENGTYIWAWNPPGINFFANITSGGGPSGGPFVIQTSNLSVGQNYILRIFPFIGTGATGDADYRIGESLMVNATISVT